MTYSRNYPATVAEVLKDDPKFKPATVKAIRRFRSAKPWQGSQEERVLKLEALYTELAAAYGVPVPKLVCRPGLVDAYYFAPHRVHLNSDTLSVVTALHEFGHALGKDERQACTWSINLFRRFFPRSYARLQHVGHTLRRPA